MFQFKRGDVLKGEHGCARILGSGRVWRSSGEPARRSRRSWSGLGPWRVSVPLGLLVAGAGLFGTLSCRIREEGAKVVVEPKTCAAASTLPCKTWTVKFVSFDMVLVPATAAEGFLMGSAEGEEGHQPDESRHRVVLEKAFWMATTEVTQELWSEVMDSSPSYFTACGHQCPVERVSWEDSLEFLNRLTTLVGGLTPAYQGKSWSPGANGFRLPTESEWEWATRAGQGSRYLYSGSNELDEVGWYDKNSGSSTHPVGQKKAYPWGLFDMSGNVWEWTWDGNGDYPSGPVTNPRGDDTASSRVYRGGSWYYVPSWARVAIRDWTLPGNCRRNLGLRFSRSE